MSTCNYDCDSCKSKCEKKDLLIKTNPQNHIKHIYGIVSGKGGVGKSLVTSLMAVASSNLGFKTCILDGDILGPSIPKMFGITEKAYATEDQLIVPAKTDGDIDIMSTTMLLDNDTEPVIWRGIMVANMIRQFYTDVLYKDQDVMFIDMPPGTGDVAITVFQSLPLDGIIIVTSPQDLVSMIVDKAYNMAKMMNVPVVGLVENYSYIMCPDCGKKIKLFGESTARKLAEERQVPFFISLPLDPSLAKLCDEGRISEAIVSDFNELLFSLLKDKE